MLAVMQLRLFLLLVVFAAAPAATQEAITPGAIADDASGTLELGALATRMTVPVSIGGAAPQPFVIDTGAERSVISRQLAGTLGLAAGPTITLTTMTGTSKVRSVVIPSLTMGPVRDGRAFNAPELEAAHMGAHGLLGIAQLRTHAVAIDFDKGEMSVRPSRRSGGKALLQPRDSEEIVITAKNRFGQLIVTEAEFEGARITVVLDTGSQISMGNLALQRRLRRIPLKGPITLISVTGEQMTVNYHIASRVKLGGVIMRGLPVAFADIPPFARFGLEDRPALMLGMDALRGFRRVEIDFPDRKVRFLLPRGVHPVDS